MLNIFDMILIEADRIRAHRIGINRGIRDQLYNEFAMRAKLAPPPVKMAYERKPEREKV